MGTRTRVRWDRAQVEALEKLLIAGATLEDCAQQFGVSKQRIGQIRTDKLPHLTRHNTGSSIVREIATAAWVKECMARFNRPTFRPQSDIQAAMSKAYIRKRQNCRRERRWEFTVKMADIEWNTVCPVFGIELDWYAEKVQENSPSFDRRDPTQGYVPGNVVIISCRANRIKNDGTSEEHRAIADWLASVEA